SAGQKRRTNLARLVAAPAPIWLLDEPTTALDRKSIGLLEGELARHRAEGGCVMLSTHQAVALPGAEDLDMSLYSLTGEAAYAVLSDLDGPSREPSRDDGFDDQDDDEDAQGWEALR
ncbi:MAG: ABC transporter ATP-binding protein, partial [Rhodospirillaceae bacterium]